MSGVFVGRQPIYDSELNVVAYELLFRRYETGNADVVDGDQATSQVILNSFMEIGLDRLVGDEPAFINLTRSFILEKYPIPMFQNRIVLEVLEDITIDDELIDALRDLSERGFKIALDDVVNPEDISSLLDIANIVKLDVIDMDEQSIKEHAAFLQNYDIQMLAEKIETHEVFELCKELGFEYFQGYFLSKPNVVEGQRLPAARLSILLLLSRIRTPGIEFREVEGIIQQDVSLSYKLLRLINSAFYTKHTEIKSIRQALTFLGLRQIQDWVSLIFLSQIEDKPRDLMTTAMVRAKMCENLGLSLNKNISDACFTVGLFSVLDALLDMPLKDILSSLPLTDDVSSALLQYKGQLGEILHTVIAYERGNWEDTMSLNLDPEVLKDAYLKAIDWAAEIDALLQQ